MASIKYIALPDTWFMQESEVVLLVDMRPEINAGIFRGMRMSEGAPELHPAGEVYEDEECCSFYEFREEVDG